MYHSLLISLSTHLLMAICVRFLNFSNGSAVTLHLVPGSDRGWGHWPPLSAPLTGTVKSIGRIVNICLLGLFFSAGSSSLGSAGGLGQVAGSGRCQAQAVAGQVARKLVRCEGTRGSVETWLACLLWGHVFLNTSGFYILQ